MNRWVIGFSLLLGLLASECLGQIFVPQLNELGRKIEATVKADAPEGAEVKVRWSVPDGVDSEQLGDRLLLWAKSGTHSIAANVVWLQTETVEIPTADGGTRQIKSLVAWDVQSYTASFQVEGELPPDPVPDDDDDDPDPQAEWDVPGLSVVITAEQGQLGMLPIDQAAIFADGAFRSWLNDITDGRSRMWDDDLSDFQNAPDFLAAGHAIAVGEADSDQPWIVVGNGKSGTSQPLPESIAATKTLIERYAE